VFEYIKLRLFRNNFGLKDIPSKKQRVNLEYSKTVNVGDSLSPLIVEWMLNKHNISLDTPINKTKHLMAVGSIVSRGRFDATLWGSGILKEEVKEELKKRSIYKKLDVRAVRGPITRDALLNAGYNCPEIYGDPAIIMPEIYCPKLDKKYDCSLILHHRTEIKDSTNEGEYEISVPKDMNIISPSTTDYKEFINKILESDLIISSSLHGIILAESYGVPAVFLNFGVADQEIKFTDWYGSTGRELTYCRTIDEALKAGKPALPDLEKMRLQLMNAFPYDLWE
jgi:pyruvyltransferase